MNPNIKKISLRAINIKVATKLKISLKAINIKAVAKLKLKVLKTSKAVSKPNRLYPKPIEINKRLIN